MSRFKFNPVFGYPHYTATIKLLSKHWLPLYKLPRQQWSDIYWY